MQYTLLQQNYLQFVHPLIDHFPDHWGPIFECARQCKKIHTRPVL